jgi:DASS family divalent anion:Na+ symporter
MLGSEPGPNALKTGGEFLHLCGNHGNLLMSAMFLSGMSGNLIVPVEAHKVFGINFTYMEWLKGSIVPGLVWALLLPFLLSRISPSKVNLKELQSDIQHELVSLGKFTTPELVLSMTLVAMLILWVTGDYTNIGSELVALGGVFFLLYTNTLKWKQVLENKGAWGEFYSEINSSQF